MPLALTYRPQRLTDLAGQERTVDLIQAMLSQWAKRERALPKSILLHGQRGCGKTSTARIIAKFLNCERKTSDLESLPCGECQSCIDISRGGSSAVIEMDAASSGGIDAIRNLQETARLRTPSKNGYRVFIIDECHRITNAAAPALLKQIEEPSPRVLYVLCTTDPHELIDTIRSRCIKFEMRNVNESDIVRRLEYIVTAEGIDLVESGAICQHLAKQAGGSLRDAIMLLETLTVLPAPITLEQAKLHLPNTTANFGELFIDALVNDGEGLELVRNAYRESRNVGALLDAILESAVNRELDATLFRELVKLIWELKLRINRANNSVTMLELLWLKMKEVR